MLKIRIGKRKNIYPFVYPFFARIDLMKHLPKLGLEVPTTAEEYYNVLKAFRDRDPNGNGKKDEIPYFDREGCINDLYQLFGAHKGTYITKDGKIANGIIEEDYRNAIRELAKWYKEGLIDPEIYTRGQQTREQLLSTNLGGSTHDWISSTAAYNDKFTDYGLNFVAMLPPADIYGVVKEDIGRSLFHGLGWGISKDNADPVRTIEYFDWWLTEEGVNLRTNGIEGVHYNMVDGEIVYTDEVLKADGGVPGFLRNQGCVEIGTTTESSSELAGMNEIAKEGFLEYKDSGIVTEQMPTLNFTQEELDKKKQCENNILTYSGEMEQKWLMGAEDVDATWDEYVTKLKSMGIDEMIKISQDAYDRYLEKIK